jgi:branched-chain amino acid transport system ATP-binding protein
MIPAAGTTPHSPGNGSGPPPTHAALEVRHLETGYRDIVVLRDVSLVVPDGTVVALLGPNGAGKTTLLRTVSGLLRPTQGTVVLNGEDVTRLRPADRAERGLCHIPQGRGIYRSLTVRENLLVQAAGTPESDAIDRAIDAFPILGPRLTQRAGTLSGGQQQMVALAAAYITESALVLIDEASLGLAPIVVDEIFEFLTRRAEAGASILIVDQFANRALRLATTAYVLRKGAIVYSGPSADLLDADLFARYLGTDAPVEG